MNKYDPNYQHKIINFRVGQKVVVFNSEGEILFLRRSAKCARPGGWDFPGGGLDDEDPIDGIKREAMEEAGIDLTEISPISLVAHDRKGANEKTLIIGYMAIMAEGKVKLSWEHDHFEWISINDSAHLELPDTHKKILEEAVELY